MVFSLSGVVLYRARISSDGDDDDDGGHMNGNDTDVPGADATTRSISSAIVLVSGYMPLLLEEFLVSHEATCLPWDERRIHGPDAPLRRGAAARRPAELLRAP